MLISLRPVDDCLIKVPDADMVAVYESANTFLGNNLLNVSCHTKDGETYIYYDNIDLEVF